MLIPDAGAAMGAFEVHVLDDDVANFLKALVRQHKTAKEKDVFAMSADQYIVRCYACDGSLGRIWREGDPEYNCVIWNRAKELGLTDGF